ncbi:mediator of RNA polymerase II transcription subunit 26 [Silurus meridionalis]|nr:mediator of RNA polymerase II transcription subunit 26 [Silurus meridionalis]
MTMTTASPTATVTAQQIRDRLLQATDAHSNINNLTAVVDVISTLEMYPITKEALEETRLGKLINDLRKKTRDEDLAKRAKKLLRNWQKLIDPQQPEILPMELSSTLNSVVRSNQSQSVPPQTLTVNDSKSVIHSVHTSSTEKFNPVKHTKKQKVEKNLPTSKGTRRSALLSASGGPEDLQISTGSVRHFSSQDPTGPTILRASVLQQPGQRDITAVEKVKRKARCQYTKQSPRSVKQLVPSKQPTSFPPTDPDSLPAHHHSKDLSNPENGSLLNSERTHEQTNNLQNKSKGLARLQPGLLSEVTNTENEKDLRPTDGKRRKPQLRDNTSNVKGRSSDDVSKPAQVKNRKLTFDPHTQQIRPSAVTPSEEQPNPALDVNEPVKQSPSTASPSPLHKMNWKDMSQNEIVKHYLNLQNNLLKTSGSQVPSAQFFMSESLKCEENNAKETNKTYIQVTEVLETGLPGIDRDITTEDVYKINNNHWPGVNGCYDNIGQWYGWTECISLDMYGDGSKLNILPYVCID